MTHDQGPSGYTPRPHLQAFSTMALLGALIIIPVDAHWRSPEVFRSLVPIYAVMIATAATVLLLSRTAFAARHHAALAWTLAIGSAAALDLYFLLSPDYPGLVAHYLTCLLVASAVLFSWSSTRAVIASGITWVSFTMAGTLVIPDAVHSAGLWLGFAALVIGGMIAVTCARVLEQFRETLAERHRELDELSARLVSAQEDERRRLSRELHDELGQSLTAVSTYLWLVERQLPPELTTLRQRTSDARRLVSKTLGEMRELSQLLCPPALTLHGLLPSLEEHVKAFGELHQMKAQFTAEGLPERLPPEVETAVYRITQEALTNVARHARARGVRVSLGTAAGQLQLEIADDGIGLPRTAGRHGTGSGLAGIGERARALGGTLSVHSGMGTRLRILLPYRGSAPRAASPTVSNGQPSRLRALQGTAAAIGLRPAVSAGTTRWS